MNTKTALWLLAGLTLLMGGCGKPGGAANARGAHDMAGMDMSHTNMRGTDHARVSALAACGTVNLAQGKVATASSTENVGTPAGAAFDSSGGTRWSSAFSDPQWLQVNLGSAQAICGVTLQWENAYGKAFKIEVTDTPADANSWKLIYSTSSGGGGTQTITPTANASGQYLRLTGTARPGGNPYGYSLWEVQVFGAPGDNPAPAGAGWVPADPPVTGVTPSQATPPFRPHREFQANCAVSRANLPDDPIVYFGKPGASHLHTFMGNTTTNANTTLASLQAGGSSCSAPDDRSAYWMPTMLNGDSPVMPTGPQVIYYKSGVIDYTSVRPFPPGLRFVVGDMRATPEEFLAGSVEGWECGNSTRNADFPTCPVGAQLNVRYQAPSCWDGLHLDSPDHKSHMAYPVGGRCTNAFPVAVPMIEFKMAFPAGADTSKVRLSSGRGSSFHYDFYGAWDPPTLKALIDHCIHRGLQCDARGFDLYHPEEGAVLGTDYRLH